MKSLFDFTGRLAEGQCKLYANTQAMATSFKLQILNGIHALGTSVTRGATTADSFKAALYVTTATVNAATTIYSSTDEVSGAGYSAGGVDLTGSPDWIAPSSTSTTAFSTPTASIVFTSVSVDSGSPFPVSV